MSFQIGDRVVYHYLPDAVDIDGYKHKNNKHGTIINGDEELWFVQFDFNQGNPLNCYEVELTKEEK